MNKELRKALNAVVDELVPDIVAALFEETGATYDVRVNRENVTADHSSREGIYLEPYFLPAPTQYLGFQQTARLYTGVYQVSVVYPAGWGTEIADTIAGVIVNSHKWKTMRIGTQHIQLAEAPYYSGVLEDVDAARVPVTISYTYCA